MGQNVDRSLSYPSRLGWHSHHWQESYGPDFTYQEYLKFDEPLAWLKTMGVTVGVGLFTGIVQQRELRSLLQPFLPQPGSGPSEQTMNEGWFSCELVGTATDGRSVRGLIQDRGDPGNRATVKFLCESALSLALQSSGGDKRPQTNINKGFRGISPVEKCPAY